MLDFAYDAATETDYWSTGDCQWRYHCHADCARDAPLERDITRVAAHAGPDLPFQSSLVTRMSTACPPDGVAGWSRWDGYIPGGSLELDLVYRVSPDDGLDDAVQQVWTAFDIAVALTEDQCDIVSRVEVQIEPQPQSAEGLTQFRASADVADLKAFHSGGVSENEFINRVQYEANPADRQ